MNEIALVCGSKGGASEMSFGKQPSRECERIEAQPAIPRRQKLNWLRGGVFCIIIGAVNIVYYSQTGKIILGPQSRGTSTAGFDLLMSVLVLVLGFVALGIHFARNRE